MNMIDSKAKKEILAYTIETLNDTLLIDESNSELREKIKRFDNVIINTQMDLDLCRQKLNELNEKKLLIQKKREILADVQRNIIKILDNQSIISDLHSNPSDYIGVPPVLMFLLETLYSATENQLSLNKIKIPISQILDMSDSINEMYNKLVDSHIIEETPAESQERNEAIAQNQQIFMNELIDTIDTNEISNDNTDSFDNNTNDDITNNEETSN